MKRLLLAVLLALTATSARAEWTTVGGSDNYDQYVDVATIRRSGNMAKMWDLQDFKRAQTSAGDTFLSSKMQSEYDCKDERVRILAFIWFSGQMGTGAVVFANVDAVGKWISVPPETVAEAQWKIACNK